MAVLNVTVDDNIKNQAEDILNELGLSISSAMDIFLRAVVTEKNLPQNLNFYIPNEITATAIEEGRKLASDKNIKGYKSISELRAALEK